MLRTKVLVFAPHSAIWVHALPEALVARGLAESGYEIKYVVCDEAFKGFCVSMSAYGLSRTSSVEEKKKSLS